MEAWEKPALALIALMWLLVVALMPLSGVTGVPPFVKMLPGWMFLSGMMALGALFIFLIRLMLAGEKEPLRRIIALEWRKAGKIVLWVFLGGVHMSAFMSLKPQLNFLIPFWADPMLARADALLFFGDPYRLLTWLNGALTADLYHRGWFLAVLATLIWQLSRAPSPSKSANLLTYFLVWASGPLIHLLLPAGGPIFYQALGHGERFSAMVVPQDIEFIAHHLWTSFTERKFAFGAGISAMPSLHIATMAWAMLCCRGTRYFWLITPFAILIFLLSISLGWHYALDGLVGGLVAWGLWALSRRFFAAARGPSPKAA